MTNVRSNGPAWRSAADVDVRPTKRADRMISAVPKLQPEAAPPAAQQRDEAGAADECG